MGSGKWNTTAYAANTLSSVNAGTNFAHTRHTQSLPQQQWKAHSDLDPHGIDVRESRDSTEHPTSLAIAVLFDVTGSMREIPGVLQVSLAKLHDYIGQAGYVEHPQVLFGAIGDATCDRVPLQIGQFESDNRMDDNLDNIFLEGGGGGQVTESYELGLYVMARHTVLDCYEKRNEKGFLFLIGDEMAYPEVKADEVREVIGSDIQGPLTFKDIVAETQEMYDVCFVLPTYAAHGQESRIRDFWVDALGAENVLALDNPEEVADVVGTHIGKYQALRSPII